MFQFRRFPSYAYLIQRTMLKYCLSGFPHSEIHGYNGYLLLPVAYRSLSRPSSAPDAKAFPLRSFQLDLSNHLLILKVELCRQFNRIFEIVIVTHLYDVPQLKLKIRSFKLSFKRPLCCLAFHHILHCSVFKVQFPVALETRSKRTTSCPLPSIFNSILVEIVGIEPATSCLQGRRSPS